jgi:hypothetical protein
MDFMFRHGTDKPTAAAGGCDTDLTAKFVAFMRLALERRHFCPSCHQKRVIEFGQWLCEEVLKHVPHRQWVFSIPKRLRIYFMAHRRLLAEFSRRAWKVLAAYLKTGVSYAGAAPGGVIAVQTFGDFQNFHPHLHSIATDGCFYGNDMFIRGPAPVPADLEDAFRREIFKLLKKEGMITDFIIDNMMGWHHSGFNVYCGKTLEKRPGSITMCRPWRPRP